MIEGLKPYPSYKPAELPTLDEVPSHWDQRRAKFLFREVDERSQTGAEELLSVSHKTGITPRSQKNVTMFKAESYVGHKLCRPNDLAINTMWAWMGALGVSRHVGIVSPAYGVYRPTGRGGLVPAYTDALLRTPAFVHEYNRRSTGIQSSRLRLYPEEFLRIPLLVPPVGEQHAIAKFIDHADRRIRRYIRAKQKLINLLEEQKQAIIHQAVTRGLNPDVRLKPSGVEWLGDVPEHWDVVRFKSAALVHGRLVDPRLPKYRALPLVAPNHIERGGSGRLLDCSSADEQGADSAKYEVGIGQIIYTKIRPYLRKASIAPFHCLCSADMYPVSQRRMDRLQTEFLLQVMLSLPFTRYVVDCSLRAAMPKVNRQALGEAPVWLPPTAEQQAILQYTAMKTKGPDRTIREASGEIALLREYRTRLIS
ncbi:MAG: restriction endonuclease subunit S, partial [Myxococcales bacterium]|nr:restriction endonuclease subunit S [Myxococcales bacterium]